MKQRRRYLAGDHVDFITIGQRNDHVGIVGAGVVEQPRVGAITTDRAYIEPILQVREYLLVDIDYGYFITLFPGEFSCHRRAYLPGA
jgi:hypothetical protein